MKVTSVSIREPSENALLTDKGTPIRVHGVIVYGTMAVVVLICAIIMLIRKPESSLRRPVSKAAVKQDASLPGQRKIIREFKGTDWTFPPVKRGDSETSLWKVFGPTPDGVAVRDANHPEKVYWAPDGGVITNTDINNYQWMICGKGATEKNRVEITITS